MTKAQIRKKLVAGEVVYTVAWELPDCFGIIISLDGTGGGTIHSDLHLSPEEMILDEGRVEYEAAIDGLESLVLAHACAGIDVNDPAYIEGIKTAVETISNNI